MQYLLCIFSTYSKMYTDVMFFINEKHNYILCNYKKIYNMNIKCLETNKANF